VPSNVFAMHLAKKDVMRARDLANSHSHAEAATGVVKVGQNDTVPAVMEVVGLQSVIAKIAEGQGTSLAWDATQILELVFQGLFATSVPERRRMQ